MDELLVGVAVEDQLAAVSVQGDFEHAIGLAAEAGVRTRLDAVRGISWHFATKFGVGRKKRATSVAREMSSLSPWEWPSDPHIKRAFSPLKRLFRTCPAARSTCPPQ